MINGYCSNTDCKESYIRIPEKLVKFDFDNTF
ncbi:hypothetical protein LCGC14_2731800, partial [marine sediment metagenome]